MKTLIHPILTLIFCSCLSVYAKRAIVPITIDPSVQSFDSLVSAKSLKTFFIATIEDTSISRSESGIVGETRIGRKKMAPIICNPIPSKVLERSLYALLVNKQVAADSLEHAYYKIEIVILDFSITEVTKKITQTMTAEIALSVKLIELKDGNTFKQFTVKTQNSFSTLDTSKHAKKVLQGTLLDALKEIHTNITE